MLLVLLGRNRAAEILVVQRDDLREANMRRLALAIVGLLSSGWAFGAAPNTVTFATLNQPAAGAAPVAFAIGDFNRDGKPDLAVVDQRSATVRIMLGVANGYFEPWVEYQVGIDPVAITTADFNGDGKLDLVVAGQRSNTVQVLLGNGDGTFRSFTTLQSQGPTALAIGDFNRDGKLDLAVANSNSNSVSIWLGLGDGSFRPALDFGVGESPSSIAVADFNRDGKLDLAVANLTSNNVSILLGTGTGLFEPILTFAAGLNPSWITLGDFNGDGKVDLAMVNATGTKSTNFVSTVSVLLGNGNGTFQAPLSTVAGGRASFLVAADLNGDGKQDLVVTDLGSNAIAILLGFGNGFFEPPLNVTVGQGPAWIGLIGTDLIVANSLSDSLSVLSNLTAGNRK